MVQRIHKTEEGFLADKEAVVSCPADSLSTKEKNGQNFKEEEMFSGNWFFANFFTLTGGSFNGDRST